MTTETDEYRQSVLAAVQAELVRHASAVVAEVDRLRDEGRRERAELRTEFTEQLRQIVAALEQVQQRAEHGIERTRQTLEQRLTESDARTARRIDDVSSGIDGMVQAAARPVLATVRDDVEALSYKVDGLDTNLRKFDEQAARMVTYFNDVTQRMEQRQDELSAALKDDVAGQIGSIKQLVEDNDSAIRRFQNEVGQSVTQKLNDAEDRFNSRLLAAESRMKEEAGQKIAEIDAHVGRVASGLDDTMVVLNDRIAGLDDRFADTDHRIDGIQESIKGLDSSELDELKEKLSTAAGEAMLVRIEMERLEKGVNEKTDGLAVRISEVETNLADATLDVSTAVQLDRMEEIERALLELDPTKFVRKDEAAGGALSPLAPPSNDALKIPDRGADGNLGIDYSAIVSAEEHRHDRDAGH